MVELNYLHTVGILYGKFHKENLSIRYATLNYLSWFDPTSYHK